MSQWYCMIRGQQYGPVDDAALHQWAAEGRLSASDTVWCEGMPQWAPAGSIAGLFPQAACSQGPVATGGQGNGMAVGGMVLGIVSTVLSCIWFLAIPCGIVGCALSAVGLRKAKQRNGSGHGMAVAGVVLSIIGVLLAILFVILAFVVEAEMMEFFEELERSG